MNAPKTERNRQMALDYAAGTSYRGLCAKYNLSFSTVDRILTRERVDPRPAIWRKRLGGRKPISKTV